MTATAGAVLALYVLLGAGCLLAGWARARAAGERVLLLLFWPLMAPFLLRPAREEPAAPGGGGRHLTPGTPATALLSALERVAHSPLAPLLPDAPTVRRLAHHLEQVSTRVDELDEVLARPTFDLEAATARQGELEAAGASPELVVGAALRCQGLQRLRALRARLSRDLDEVSELMSQLVIQVELVRFAGAGDDGSRAILGELLGRVDGLAQMLDDQGGPAAARP